MGTIKGLENAMSRGCLYFLTVWTLVSFNTRIAPSDEGPTCARSLLGDSSFCLDWLPSQIPSPGARDSTISYPAKGKVIL